MHRSAGRPSATRPGGTPTPRPARDVTRDRTRGRITRGPAPLDGPGDSTEEPS